MFTLNSLLSRAALLDRLIDPRRDIDAECGYPKEVSAQQYRNLYDKEGIATRVVSIFSDACWTKDPEVLEGDGEERTPFEEAWVEINDRLHLLHYLHRIDELSGIGHFGVLLIGFDDGKPLDEPVEKGGVIYLRPLDESLVEIATFETDIHNPRFGQPLYYNVQFADLNSVGRSAVAQPDLISRRVHWTRCLHVADNRKCGEVFGTPRMEKVFKRLYDLQKLYGGSAEMFWKGAFPGFSFEVNPNLVDVEIDKAAMRDEFTRYSNGLQRYLALQGVTAKSLSPQVADPIGHIDGQLEAIAIAIDVPVRIFKGTEEAKLAGSQDKIEWDEKVARRRERYVAPMIVLPFVQRLVEVRALPEPSETPYIRWPDAPSDPAKAADVAARRIDAVAKYLQAQADTLIPPKVFLTKFLDFDDEEADAMLEEAQAGVEPYDVEAMKELAMTFNTASDPTRTASLRAAYAREMRKRFASLRDDVRRLIVGENALGLVQNVRWAFESDPRKVASFERWFRAKVKAEITDDLWARRFVRQSYEKGIARAYQDVSRRAGKQLVGGFVRQALDSPEALNELELLYTRNYAALEGVGAEADARMSRVLADGLLRKLSPEQIARNLTKEIDTLTKARAATIANTELVNAHAEAQLTALEKLGVANVKAQAEWITAGDSRVCPQCKPMEGQVFTIRQARGLIPRHPNCRCAWQPVLTVTLNHAGPGPHPSGSPQVIHSPTGAVKWAQAVGEHFGIESPEMREALRDAIRAHKGETQPIIDAMLRPDSSRTKILQKFADKPLTREEAKGVAPARRIEKMLKDGMLEEVDGKLQLTEKAKRDLRNAGALSDGPAPPEKEKEAPKKEKPPEKTSSSGSKKERLKEMAKTKKFTQEEFELDAEQLSMKYGVKVMTTAGEEGYSPQYTRHYRHTPPKDLQVTARATRALLIELDDMAERYPGMKAYLERGKVNFEFTAVNVSPKTGLDLNGVKVTGTYTQYVHSGALPAIGIAAKSTSYGGKTKAPGSRDWVLGESVDATIRHEIGHAIWYNALPSGTNRKLREILATHQRSYKKGYSKPLTSFYGDSNVEETWAEAFNYYTSEDYQPGKLHPEIESLLDAALKVGRGVANHAGPGPHPSGSPQAVHSKGGSIRWAQAVADRFGLDSPEMRDALRDAVRAHGGETEDIINAMLREGSSRTKILQQFIGKRLTREEAAKIAPARRIEKMIRDGMLEKVDGKLRLTAKAREDLISVGVTVDAPPSPPPQVDKPPRPPKVDKPPVGNKKKKLMTELKTKEFTREEFNADVEQLSQKYGVKVTHPKDRVYVSRDTQGHEAVSDQELQGSARATRALLVELDDMTARYPNMRRYMTDGKTTFEFTPIPTAGMGGFEYKYLGGRRIAGGLHTQRLQREEHRDAIAVVAGLPVYGDKTVDPGTTDWTVGTSIDAIIRHEVGHVVWLNMDKPFGSVGELRAVYEKHMRDRGRGRGKTLVSTYGDSCLEETWAEAFCYYTSSDYKPGKLHPELETVLDRVLIGQLNSEGRF